MGHPHARKKNHNFNFTPRGRSVLHRQRLEFLRGEIREVPPDRGKITNKRFSLTEDYSAHLCLLTQAQARSNSFTSLA
jgi:hypothetical protein